MSERRRLHSSSLVAALLPCLAVSALLPQLAVAAEVPSDADAPPAFRRLYAPSDRKQDWPFRAERYLPIEPDEFERAVTAAVGTAQPPATTAVVAAEFTARFDGRNRLVGEAEITLRPPSPGPQLVPLADGGSILTNCVWKGDKRPAVVGSTSDGRSAVWVETPGVLVAEWTLVGRIDDAGGASFDLALPAAPISPVRLTLPDGFQIQSTTLARGTTRPTEDDETEETLRAVAGRGRVRIVPVDKAAAVRRPTVRQDATYEFSERGIDMAVQLRIDAVGEPLERLELDVDPTLTIVDVRLPDRRPAWTESIAAKPAPRRVVVEFDPPLFGTGRTVLVRGLATSQIGKRQTLPAIHCPQMDWLQGTVSLAVAAPLVVERIDPTLCTADVPHPLAGSRNGEAIAFTCFDPKAAVRVLVSRVRDQLDVTGLTAVAFGKDETTAEYRAELRISGAERFVLQANVPTRWIVDSVTTEPAGIVGDWSMSDVIDGRRRLTLRPTSAFKPNQPLRVVVAARSRRSSLGTTINPEELRVAEFLDARVDVSTAAVRADDAWRLELDRAADDASPTIEQLDPVRRDLLGDFRAQHLLDLRPSAAPWRLKLERRAPRIETDSQVVAALSGDSLTEKYFIRLKNRDDRPVDRITIRFYPPRPTPIAWSLENDRRGRLDARRSWEKSGDKIVGESWEVVFQNPVDDELVLEAVRRSKWDTAVEISLPSATDAAAQQGVVTIESDAATPVAVDRTLLTSVSIDRGTERRRLIRGEFRFDATQVANPEVPGRPIVRRLPAADAPIAAVAWNAGLQTAYESDGRLLHRFRLRVQSFGGDAFRWTFPNDAERLTIEAGGTPITVTGTSVEIPLPARAEFVVVTATFERQSIASGPFTQMELPLLEVDIPVLQENRDVLLPPQWEIVSGGVVDAKGAPILPLREAVAPWLRFVGFQSTTSQARLPDSDELAVGKLAAKFWKAESVGGNRGVAATTATLYLVRRETLWAAAFAVAALAAGVGYRWSTHKRRRVILLALALACGLSLPNALPVLCFSGLLGLAAAWCAEMLLPGLYARRVRSTRAMLGTREPSATIGSTTLRTPATAVLFIGLLTHAGSLQAQSAAEKPQDVAPPTAQAARVAAAETLADAAPLPAVFIPVDDRGRPTGERLLVPERLWRALTAAGSNRAEVPAGGVLITDAQYDVTIVQDGRRGFPIPSEIRGVWNLFAPTGDGEASLAFPDFGGVSAAVLLDGRPADAVRTADGSRWSVAVEKAGAHRLEIILRPPVDAAFDRGGVTFAVPRVLDGRLRLNAPPDLTGLVVEEAADSLTVSDDRRSVEVVLRPSERLTMTWNEGVAQAGTVEFDQYEWWRVRPGIVTVDVRLRVVSKFAAGREIALVADPRLQWLPRRSADGDSLEVSATPIVVEQANVGQRLKVALPKTLQPDAVIETSFLLNGAAGAGRLRLPELRVESQPARRRIVAVSVDPAFDFTVQGTSGIVAAAVPEFEKLWGATAASPQLAFECTTPHVDWQLSTRPKPTRLTAEETQTLVCGRRRIDVAYVAEATVTGDAVARHEVSAPPELEVDSASVVGVDGEEQLLRWSRDDAGAICLFLRSPQHTTHRISLNGRLLQAKPAEIAFPFLGLRGATGTRTFRVVRLPDASVTVRDLKQLSTEQATATGETLGNRGRLELVLRAVGATPSAKLKIGENDPQTTAQVASTLRREAQSWEFETVVHMNVTAGRADEIRLDFPPEIATPVTITPTMPYEATADADGAQRSLILRPQEPIRGEFQFAIRAKASTVDPTHGMPIVRLLGTTNVEYFFQLPARSGLNRVGWDVRQMAPAELPAGFSKPLTEEMLTYRAVGPEPKAALRDVRRGAGAAFIRLADHFVRSDSRGNVGVTNWLVEPAGTTEFRMRLPTGAELLHLRVGGADVVPTQSADRNEIRFPSASDQMPHLIEVAYRSPATPAAPVMSPTLEAPELIGPTVDRTIWTVEQADGGENVTVDDVTTVPQWRAQLDRARAFDAVLLEFAADESLGIAGRWADAVAGRRRRLKQEMEASPRPTDAAERREWEAIVQRVIAAGASEDDALQSGNRPADLDAVWDTAVVRRGRRSYWSSAGALTTATVANRSTWSISYLGGWLYPVLTATLWPFAIWMRRCDGWLRWSRLLGTTVAVFACIALEPPAIGWTIVAVLVACEFHGSLRYAKERQPSFFTVVRPMR